MDTDMTRMEGCLKQTRRHGKFLPGSPDRQGRWRNLPWGFPGIRAEGGGLPASYTVEASYIMTIVLLSLSLLIRTAYEECREAAGVMRLHHIVELVRCGEDEERKDFSFQAVSGSALKRNGKVCATAAGENWQKEIEAGVFEPESRMRMLTVFDYAAEGDKRDDGT